MGVPLSCIFFVDRRTNKDAWRRSNRRRSISGNKAARRGQGRVWKKRRRCGSIKTPAAVPSSGVLQGSKRIQDTKSLDVVRTSAGLKRVRQDRPADKHQSRRGKASKSLPPRRFSFYSGPASIRNRARRLCRKRFSRLKDRVVCL